MLIIKMAFPFFKILNFVLGNKHIDIQYHYIHEQIELKFIQLWYIPMLGGYVCFNIIVEYVYVNSFNVYIGYEYEC
jgi:hypothetical protein